MVQWVGRVGAEVNFTEVFFVGPTPADCTLVHNRRDRFLPKTLTTRKRVSVSWQNSTTIDER